MNQSEICYIQKIIEDKKRCDGRKFEENRPLRCVTNNETGINKQVVVDNGQSKLIIGITFTTRKEDVIYLEENKYIYVSIFNLFIKKIALFLDKEHCSCHIKTEIIQNGGNLTELFLYGLKVAFHKFQLFDFKSKLICNTINRRLIKSVSSKSIQLPEIRCYGLFLHGISQFSLVRDPSIFEEDACNGFVILIDTGVDTKISIPKCNISEEIFKKILWYFNIQ